MKKTYQKPVVTSETIQPLQMLATSLLVSGDSAMKLPGTEGDALVRKSAWEIDW